ncbi:LysM peptidoglycan-binding domain-containing protein [Lacibacter luteus]|uniref:LysM peptidoglycan-binding domain-containing protein n=1 Tax=Lacibacter luteus TaxID=2508719 RepID=A0A4Q1CDD5_9BACT|nr:LysM peptidoglycan-binding domain-containing protein [Lacibacter luteus]RXK57576.1 LysM peptidoglycan-binding domain-containing protein [Lacibacter luteus]
MTTKVLYGETLADIAARLGNAAAAYDIALLNNIGITDDLVAGTILIVPDAIKKNTAAFNSGVAKPLTNEVKVLKNQTVSDLAVQYLGDAERVVELAALNNISTTEMLIPGQMIKMPVADIQKQRIVTVFNNPATAPASYYQETNDQGEVLEGIGYWIIQDDFKVS